MKPEDIKIGQHYLLADNLSSVVDYELWLKGTNRIAYCCDKYTRKGGTRYSFRLLYKGEVVTLWIDATQVVRWVPAQGEVALFWNVNESNAAECKFAGYIAPSSHVFRTSNGGAFNYCKPLPVPVSKADLPPLTPADTAALLKIVEEQMPKLEVPENEQLLYGPTGLHTRHEQARLEVLESRVAKLERWRQRAGYLLNKLHSQNEVDNALEARDANESEGAK